MGHNLRHSGKREFGYDHYIHVTEPHVMTCFERFLNYHATGLVNAVKEQTERVQ
jgi:hypothetical protein